MLLPSGSTIHDEIAFEILIFGIVSFLINNNRICIGPLYSIGFLFNDFQGKLTYGKIGEWRFDKRSYDNAVPPKNLPLPPPGVAESVVCLISPRRTRFFP